MTTHKIETFRFRLIGGRDIPDHDTVEAIDLSFAISRMIDRYGKSTMLYRVNLNNDGLYWRPTP
jgi:hypothetical protein